MIHIKVHQGTISDRHLCDTCDHANRRIEGGRQRYDCCVHGRIRSTVTQCESYRDKENLIAIRELDAQAWYLDRGLEDEDGEEHDGILWRSPAERITGRRRTTVRVRGRRRKNPIVDAEFTDPPKSVN